MSDTKDPSEAYRATVSMLLAHTNRASKVTIDDIHEVAAMDADELRRRTLVNRDWHRLYACSLDGLPDLGKLGIAVPPEGCWMPKDIRRVVEVLLKRAAGDPGSKLD
jgi:hypothetical protein